MRKPRIVLFWLVMGLVLAIPTVAVQSPCDKTLKVGGHTCVLFASDCSADGLVCVCAYNCPFLDESFQTSPAEERAAPQASWRLQPELAFFDNLTIEKQKGLLSKKGPYLPSVFDINDIPMRVFVKGNWPFYISYSLKQGSAFLTITVNDIEPFSEELKPGEKMQAVFNLPERFGSELSVARISLTAASGSEFVLHAVGIMEEDDGSKNQSSRDWIRTRLREPITDVTATPDKISTSKEEKIAYSFFSRVPYSSGAADFFLYKYDSKDGILPTLVYSDQYSNIKANERTKEHKWYGKNWHGKFSFGTHRLQIRTWRGQRQGGQWFCPSYGPQVEVLK